MAAYPLISSDSHVVEPPDLWTTRIDANFRDRAPFMVEGDEADQWYVEAGTPMGQIGANLQAGVRFEDPDKLTFEAKYRTSPRGAYDPHARLVEMSEDHVSAEVLYSSLALSLFQVVQDDALLAAIFRAYNDWLADFIAVDPKRLKGIASGAGGRRGRGRRGGGAVRRHGPRGRDGAGRARRPAVRQSRLRPAVGRRAGRRHAGDAPHRHVAQARPAAEPRPLFD